MSQSNNVKIVVFVPESHADLVRDAMGKAGAGKIGNYAFCSFSSKGVGRFLPQEGAHPAIGKVGKLEFVAEERIEVVCSRDILNDVISAMKKVHPYEEVAFDIYPLEEV
ncbi:MAG: YqfO family protein [Candidatus Buchananbacteria bacterium]